MARGIIDQYGGGSGSSPAGTYNWTAPYGGKPIVPDPNASAGTAISGNLSNLPGALNLAGQVNSFNQGQLLDQYNSAIPNYSGLVANESGLISGEMAGQLPADVLNLISQQGAEHGVQTGSPGSPNANAAWLRGLGLTSLDLQQTGLGNLSKMISQAPHAPLFNVESQMTTPGDIQSADWMRNEIAAAPDPKAAAELAIGLGRGGSNAPQKGTNFPTINPGSSTPRPPPGSKGMTVPTFASDGMGTVGGVNPFSAAPPTTGQQDPNYYTNPAPYGSWGNNVGSNSPGYGSQKMWKYDETMGGWMNSITGEFSDTNPDTGNGETYIGDMAGNSFVDPYADNPDYYTPAK